MTEYIFSSNDYYTLINNGEVDEFKKKLSQDEWSITHNLPSLAANIVYHNKIDMMKILMVDFGFLIDNDFIEKHCNSISFEMLQFLTEMTNINYLETMKKENLTVLFHHAFINKNIEMIKLLLQYGFDINTFDMYFMFKHKLNDNYYDVLKFLLENNLSLKFVDEELKKILIKDEKVKIIHLMVEHGINFNTLNNVTLSGKFNNFYNLLVDLDIDPKVIAYITST
jgi:hypothetical protein